MGFSEMTMADAKSAASAPMLSDDFKLLRRSLYFSEKNLLAGQIARE